MNSESSSLIPSPSSLLLRMERICKAFPGVQALDQVDFDLRPAEVHALVGENGAGKSTLIKILAGAQRPDAGEIWLDGRHIEARSPADMMAAGVRCIYQELNLVPELSVAENIFLGNEPARWRFLNIVDWAKMRQRSREILQGFQLPIDPRTPVARLGVAYRQIVEIAKALSSDAKVIVMDEPTAALTDQEAGKLFSIIATLKEKRVAIIYISHRLNEIRRIADRVTVLRDGRRIMTEPAAHVSHEQLIRAMVGRDVAQQYPKRRMARGPELLRVEHLASRGVCDDVSFCLHRGEILGLAGLAGAGRTEIIEVLFGRRGLHGGGVWLRGQPLRIKRPCNAVAQGIGLIPEDRKADGLVLGLTVLDNITLTVLDRCAIAGVIRRHRLAAMARQTMARLGIKASPAQLARNLSGGNQQKVVVGKWFLRNCDVYIFDEPTRGIDVGAKTEIYRLMEDLAERGAGILMISSEMTEILNLSDRILVLRKGHIVAELDGTEADQETILRYAMERD
jgi:ribose transport system ATP-binding protein